MNDETRKGGFSLSVTRDPESSTWIVVLNQDCVGRVVELGPGQYATTKQSISGSPPWVLTSSQDFASPLAAIFFLISPEASEALHRGARE